MSFPIIKMVSTVYAINQMMKTDFSIMYYLATAIATRAKPGVKLPIPAYVA